MEQIDVRYCTTADGVRIAYTVTGSGPPLIYTPEPLISHVQLERTDPFQSLLYSELARGNTLIRFDVRGSGLSDRVMAATIDEELADLEAVVARVGLSEFALGAMQTSAFRAISYAARFPDRVTRLVIIDGFLRMADLLDTPQARALTAAAAGDFVMATEAVAAAAFGPGRAESRVTGAYIRACIGPDYFATAAITGGWDASEVAARITVPTLLVHHRDLQYVTDEMTRDIAAKIPDARLLTVEGRWADDYPGLAAHITGFVNEGTAAPAARRRDEARGANPTPPSGMTAILFADIVDSTALTERMGDAAFRERARALDAALRAIISGAGGSVIDAKTLGDGVLATFAAASQAIDAALRCAAAGDEQSLPLHLGLHAGDVIREQNNVFGGAVNIASRISGMSAPGEVLVSDVVRALARTSASVTFEDRGEHALKGVGDPQRVYAVRKGGG